MERFIVYLDDADYAQQQLAPLKNAATPAAHWVLVGCAPRLTRRIGNDRKIRSDSALAIEPGS